MSLTENFTDVSSMATAHAAHHNAMAALLNKQVFAAPQYVSGRYYTNRILGSTSNGNYTAVASFIIYTPVFVFADITINDVAIKVATAGSAGALTRIGLYDVASALPHNRLYDWGTVATDTTGEKHITGLSVTLTQGFYCFALSTTSTTPGVFAGTAIGLTPMLGGGSGAFSDISNYSESGTGTLPSTVSGSLTQSATATLPLVCFKVA